MEDKIIEDIDKLICEVNDTVKSFYDEIVPKSDSQIKTNYDTMADMLVESQKLKDITEEINMEREKEQEYLKTLTEEQKLEYLQNKSKTVTDFALNNSQNVSSAKDTKKGV